MNIEVRNHFDSHLERNSIKNFPTRFLVCGAPIIIYWCRESSSEALHKDLLGTSPADSTGWLWQGVSYNSTWRQQEPVVAVLRFLRLAEGARTLLRINKQVQYIAGRNWLYITQFNTKGLHMLLIIFAVLSQGHACTCPLSRLLVFSVIAMVPFWHFWSSNERRHSVPSDPRKRLTH